MEKPSMATCKTCYVIGCGSSDYQLMRWRQKTCQVHDVPHEDSLCDCPPPFRFFTFPTERANPEARSRWIKACQRAEEGSAYKFKYPTKSQRICSKHFINNQPSEEHPDPVLDLGHTHKVVNPKLRQRRDRTQSEIPTKKTRQSVPAPGPSTSKESSKQCNHKIGFFFILALVIKLYRKTKAHNSILQQENMQLKRQIALLNSQLTKRNQTRSFLHSVLKNNKNVSFFTGIPNVNLFNSLHEYISPYVRKRWRGPSLMVNKVRKFILSPKKFGPTRKLQSKEEFLLTLMKLRLGLLYQDVAQRFNISSTLATQVFHSWLTAMNTLLSHLVWFPPKEYIQLSKPKRYNCLPDLRSIIDASELFIETPKNPQIQACTYSTYKHHNTAKFLIACAPNSAITYISPMYGGRASDKEITIQCGFLDLHDPHDMIQADKGISNECAARNITFQAPPGRRGQAQMAVPSVIKTKRIANLRILIEQVIRRLKIFRILSTEIPITMVPHLDKVVKVCAALTNLKCPIYKD